MKLVLPRKYYTVIACLCIIFVQVHVDLVRAQEAPMRKIWREHNVSSENNTIIPRKNYKSYAADMPMKSLPSTEPKFIEPNIDHFADPFAKKYVETQKNISEIEASKPTSPKQSPLPNKLLEYMLMDMNLRDFLQELTKENSLFAITLARDVDGQIKNARLNGTMEEILQKLAREFNFEWMIDGPELFIASRTKMEFKTVQEKRLTDEQFQEIIADIYAPNLHYILKNNRLSGTIEIRGPKDFVKRLEQRFENTEAGQMKIIRAGKVFTE